MTFLVYPPTESMELIDQNGAGGMMIISAFFANCVALAVWICVGVGFYKKAME